MMFYFSHGRIQWNLLNPRLIGYSWDGEFDVEDPRYQWIQYEVGKGR